MAMSRVLLVGRTRYRFPLAPPLRRKFEALDERLDMRVLATAATPSDRGAAANDGFELVPPRRLLAGPRFYLGFRSASGASSAASSRKPSSLRARTRPSVS
jgi:hypothetical protein